ncbi:hypothetical protein F8M41_007973 [Gigaspora margarita]|uniref:Uncharacterized protein n=1 Tax=Gigaspora margarita TaxID=4874 RepID=A0A8H4AW38_GIGMA|nr:hypothetical protein F8M41_007973 [Gigaspora margarita]
MSKRIFKLKEPKGMIAERQTDNEATNSALKRAQKLHLQKKQSYHKTLSQNKTVNQRYEEEDTTFLIGYKNNNLVSSQASLSDNESDNIYGNNVSTPHGNDVSSPAHRNISLSVHENDISLPVHENNISLPNHRNDNEFQIALWVVYHKRILDLATNIRNGMMTKIDEVSGATSTPILLHEPVLKFLEIDQHVKFQLQEECKALFLRTRNNSSVLYEEIIVQTCKIAKTDQRLGSLIKDVGRWYNTYRYTLHTSAVKLVNKFRSINKKFAK